MMSLIHKGRINEIVRIISANKEALRYATEVSKLGIISETNNSVKSLLTEFQQNFLKENADTITKIFKTL